MISPFASSGGGLVFAAAIIYIFVGIANFTLDQVVPRHLRLVIITTEGLGRAITSSAQIRSSNSIYGNPDAPENQRTNGDGLRLYYTWGLWNRCAGYNSASDPQYCTSTHWAHRMQPTAAILEDVPAAFQSRASSMLNDPKLAYQSDHYFRAWSRIAFYFIFISAALVGALLLLSIIGARGPSRLGALGLSSLSGLALLSGTLGAVIWTAIVGILKHHLNRNYSDLGMSARYGNAVWLLWAIDGILLLSTFGYLGDCIRGRRHRTYGV